MLRRNMLTAACQKSGDKRKTLGLHSTVFSELGDGNTRLNYEIMTIMPKITCKWSSWASGSNSIPGVLNDSAYLYLNIAKSVKMAAEIERMASAMRTRTRSIQGTAVSFPLAFEAVERCAGGC